MPVFAQSRPQAAKFDPEDRLTTLGTYAFRAGYDGDGLRSWSDPNAGSDLYFLYDGSRPALEEDTNANETSLNLFGATGLEMRYHLAGGSPNSQGLNAYAFDPQGNLAQTLSLYSRVGTQFAQVVTAAAFDAYGYAFTLAPEGQADPSDPVGFGGQFGYYRDGYTNLYLLTHRYYDAGTGRFINRDPIGYKGGINLYGFAGNNPVNESDPSGFDPFETYSGVGHMLPNANQEYTDGYQQYTQGQVSEYGDNYHALAPVGGGGGTGLVGAIEGWFSRLFSGGRSLRTQRGMVMIPRLKGKSASQIEKTLRNSGFSQTKVSNSPAKNQTWQHSDGTQVLIHPYGDVNTGQYRTGNNGHVHKYDPNGVKLNDRGIPDSDPNNNHIGISNPNDLPTIRNRQHGTGNK